MLPKISPYFLLQYKIFQSPTNGLLMVIIKCSSENMMLLHKATPSYSLFRIRTTVPNSTCQVNMYILDRSHTIMHDGTLLMQMLLVCSESCTRNTWCRLSSCHCCRMWDEIISGEQSLNYTMCLLMHARHEFFWPAECLWA